MLQATAEAPRHSSLTDEVLVAAARERPADFGLLYERYMPRVYRYMAARSPSREDAADLTQTVFTRAFDALPRYRSGGAPFVAWLFRIARNTATDAHRRRRPTVAWDALPDALDAWTDQPTESAERQERIAVIRSHVARLQADKQELLALRFASDLSVREIAAVVGRSEASVKKQLTRTISTLKEHYREELP